MFYSSYNDANIKQGQHKVSEQLIGSWLWISMRDIHLFIRQTILSPYSRSGPVQEAGGPAEAAWNFWWKRHVIFMIQV